MHRPTRTVSRAGGYGGLQGPPPLLGTDLDAGDDENNNIEIAA